MADEEVHYAICGAEVDPYNESPWRYLIGVVMEQWRCAEREGDTDEIVNASKLLASSIEQINQIQQSLTDKAPSDDATPAPPCVSLMSAQLDLLELSIDDKQSFEKASSLCKTLAEVDPVRRKYWRKRGKDVMGQIGKSN